METQQVAQVEQFASELLRVRRQDGAPSYRTLRMRMQKDYSISTISRVLSGKSFPRWDFTEKFLRACHVGEQDIEGRWRISWIALAETVSPIGGMSAGDEDDEVPERVTPAGTECAQCGAWVINQLLHQAWHATYIRSETARARRRPSSPDSIGTSRTLRSLPG